MANKNRPKVPAKRKAAHTLKEKRKAKREKQKHESHPTMPR